MVMLIYLYHAYTETSGSAARKANRFWDRIFMAPSSKGPSIVCGRECSGKSGADVRTRPPHCQSSQARPILNRLSVDFGDRARDSLTPRRANQSALIWL